MKARFEMRESGSPKSKATPPGMVEFVIIEIGKDVVERPATDRDRHLFKSAYAEFRKASDPPTGTGGADTAQEPVVQKKSKKPSKTKQ